MERKGKEERGKVGGSERIREGAGGKGMDGREGWGKDNLGKEE